MNSILSGYFERRRILRKIEARDEDIEKLGLLNKCTGSMN